MTRIEELRDKIRDLCDDAGKATEEIEGLNTAWRRYLALARRVGLPEPIMEAMARLQQLRIAIGLLYKSAIMLQAVSGPLGWATAVGGLMLGTVMLADQAELQRPHY